MPAGALEVAGLRLRRRRDAGTGRGRQHRDLHRVNATLFEPLPFNDPDRLAFVWSDMTSTGYPRGPLSGPELDDLRRRTTHFDGFGAIWATTTTLTGDGDPQMLRIGLVTADFFRWLGAHAALGRIFTTEDETTAAPTAILLSAGLWQRRYGSDPTVVVEDVREQVYFPVRQVPRNPMAYVVRTEADASSLATVVRSTLDELDPQLPIYDLRQLRDAVLSARATHLFTMRLAALFAAVALCMACVGVYGVMAYSVAKRRVEFGVRLALGAAPRVGRIACPRRCGAGVARAGTRCRVCAQRDDHAGKPAVRCDVEGCRQLPRGRTDPRSRSDPRLLAAGHARHARESNRCAPLGVRSSTLITHREIGEIGEGLFLFREVREIGRALLI